MSVTVNLPVGPKNDTPSNYVNVMSYKLQNSW